VRAGAHRRRARWRDGPDRLRGLFFALAYAALQQIFRVIAEVPGYVTRASSRIFPAATVNAAITPNTWASATSSAPHRGRAGRGGVLGWLGIIPLIAALVPPTPSPPSWSSSGISWT